MEESNHMKAAQSYNELMVDARNLTAEVDALLSMGEMDQPDEAQAAGGK